MQNPHNQPFSPLPSVKTRTRSLAQKLREARLSARLSQTASAAQLRKPQSYISRCESGIRRIDIFELQEFARLYHKPLAYFVEHPSNLSEVTP